MSVFFGKITGKERSEKYKVLLYKSCSELHISIIAMHRIHIWDGKEGLCYQSKLPKCPKATQTSDSVYRGSLPNATFGPGEKLQILH